MRAGCICTIADFTPQILACRASGTTRACCATRLQKSELPTHALQHMNALPSARETQNMPHFALPLMAVVTLSVALPQLSLLQHARSFASCCRHRAPPSRAPQRSSGTAARSKEVALARSWRCRLMVRCYNSASRRPRSWLRCRKVRPLQRAAVATRCNTASAGALKHAEASAPLHRGGSSKASGQVQQSDVAGHGKQSRPAKRANGADGKGAQKRGLRD